MLTIGVDLAAEPARTARAVVDRDAHRAAITEVIRGAGDEAIVAALARAGKAGIDCPLGWPDTFVAFVADGQSGHSALGIHSNVRRRFGDIERRAARRIFLTCLGALTRVRCAAFFPLRRAFLTSLGASSKKSVHSAHFRIRVVQPTITAGHLAFRVPPLRADHADGADSHPEDHDFPPSGG